MARNAPPPEVLGKVQEEIARVILAHAEVLAQRCAAACVHQVWSAVAQVPELRQADFPKEREVAPEGPRRHSARAPVDVADPWGHFLEADAKGKGKGKGKGPPPPKAKATAKALPEGLQRRQSGMSELLARVEAEGQRKDREEAKEFSDLDLSQISPDAVCERVACSRCEQEVPKEHLESHMTAHSSEILPWLYLGGKRNLENDKELTVRTQITHVLNLAQEVNLKEEIRQLATDYQANRGLKFVYKKVGLSDTPDEDLLKHMDGILDFIHQAHQDERSRVLVNCVQGISRSSAVVLAYLMKFEKMSLRDAYHFLRHRRSIADPRKEFLVQLGQLECVLFNLRTPTLTGDLAFAGRHMLNLDDGPMPVPQKDVADPETRHELEALQKVLHNLNAAVKSIGAEAEAAAEAVRAMGRDAGSLTLDAAYASRHTLEVPKLQMPELQVERQACEALLDYMQHAAAAMLEQRDQLRRHAEEVQEAEKGPTMRPIV